jgi:hypothetical protein
MKRAAKKLFLEELQGHRVSLAACLDGRIGQLPIQDWVGGKFKMTAGEWKAGIFLNFFKI